MIFLWDNPADDANLRGTRIYRENGTLIHEEPYHGSPQGRADVTPPQGEYSVYACSVARSDGAVSAPSNAVAIVYWETPAAPGNFRLAETD